MVSKEVIKQIDQWIAAHTQELVDDVITLTNIRSVSQFQGGKEPFGAGCAAVLTKVYQMAQNQGLAVVNYDNYCAVATLPGKDKGELCLFGHLDVVPEGENWTRPPFDAYVKNGNIYGRGAADNKGPALACLYVLRCMRDLKIHLNRDASVFFGCNEECGMEDVAYYLQHHKAPDFSIIADSTFSVCHGEKGILTADLLLDVSGSNIVDFSGGHVSNMIPDRAYMILDHCSAQEAESALKAYKGLTVTAQGAQRVRIDASGVCGHAAMPEGAVSATHLLAKAVSVSGLVSGRGQKVLTQIADMFSDYYGEGLKIACEDDISGKLTHIGGVLRLKDSCLIQNINVRYPVTVSPEWVADSLRAFCDNNGIALQNLKNDAPAYVPESHPAIGILNDICNDVLGTNYSPFVMGGGTYARKLPNAVAYGPDIAEKERPDGPDRGGAHQPDECVNIQMLLNGIKIYILALMELDQLSAI